MNRFTRQFVFVCTKSYFITHTNLDDIVDETDMTLRRSMISYDYLKSLKKKDFEDKYCVLLLDKLIDKRDCELSGIDIDIIDAISICFDYKEKCLLTSEKKIEVTREMIDRICKKKAIEHFLIHIHMIDTKDDNICLNNLSRLFPDSMKTLKILVTYGPDYNYRSGKLKISGSELFDCLPHSLEVLDLEDVPLHDEFYLHNLPPFIKCVICNPFIKNEDEAVENEIKMFLERNISFVPSLKYICGPTEKDLSKEWDHVILWKKL